MATSERELIRRLEAADALELAAIIATAKADEERVLRAHLGDERFRRMRDKVVRHDLTRRRRAVQGNVVVLHGIMGGELSAHKPGDDDLLWVSMIRVLKGDLTRLRLAADGATDATSGWTVGATGMLKRYYGDLLLWLAANWNVKSFYYDWRKSLDGAAADLDDRIRRWFAKGTPVHLVAHSMGGLVARTFIANHRETWNGMWDERGNGHRGGRLVMLGTPNHGSFAIPQVITGIEPLVRKIAKADLCHSLAELRDVFNTFPGSLQMLPSPFKYGSLRPLYDAEAYGPLGISQSHLTAALDHHTKLSTVIDPDRMVYVAGFNQPTFSYVDPKLDAMADINAYAVTRDGDGRVPHGLGLLDKVTTHFVETDHGGLSEQEQVFPVIGDILDRGQSSEAPTTLPARPRALPAAKEQSAIRAELLDRIDREVADVERIAARRRARGADETAAPDDDRRAEELIVRGLLGNGSGLEPNGPAAVITTGPKEAPHPVHVTVNLALASIDSIDDVGGPAVDAVAVGHYIGVLPQAAEKKIDDAVTGAMTPNHSAHAASRGVIAEFTERGLLRGGLGEPFFINDARAAGRKNRRLVAVLGLGEPGHLGIPELTVAVRELCWSLGRLGKKHLAAVLIGAGPGNLPVADAVNAWMRGLHRALADGDPKQRGSLNQLTFVEVDGERMNEIADALCAEQSRQQIAGLHIALGFPTDPAERRWRDHRPAGVRSRTDGGRAAREDHHAPPTVVTVSRNDEGYVFAALTEDASVPERAVPVDHALVLEANQKLASAADTGQQQILGRTLLDLIVPKDLRGHLRSTAPLVMVVDATTARLHWEMMADRDEDGEADDAFMAIGRGFTRRLRTPFARPPEPPPPAARTLRVLVAADPAEDARLPGAALEGLQVAELFERFNKVHAASGHRVEVTRLFGPEEATRLNVMMAITQGRYDVLHFAGHCTFNPARIADSGWIFSGGSLLTARELNRIDRVPPFIFSNACESGITPERASARAIAAAPSFAEAFFAQGVSNFICTAWEVDDEAARNFAISLYTELLGLQAAHGLFANLADALRVARQSIFEQAHGVTTWGAYQHYGTPTYRFFEPLTPSHAATAAQRKRADHLSRKGHATARRARTATEAGGRARARRPGRP